jgi:hypothetical protein
MIHHGVVSVGITPTFVGPLSVMPYRMHLHNNDNTDEVYLGGTGVTTSNGFRLLKQDSFEMILNPKDAIYAISTKNGHSVSYFAVTQ